MKQFATDLFKAGNKDQALVKKSNGSMDFGWGDAGGGGGGSVPGTNGEFLMSDGNGGIVSSHVTENNMASKMNPKITQVNKQDVGEILVQMTKYPKSDHQTFFYPDWHIDENDPTKLIVSIYTQYEMESGFIIYLYMSSFNNDVESVTPPDLTAEFEYYNYLKLELPYDTYEAGTTKTYEIQFESSIANLNTDYRYNIYPILTVPEADYPSGRVLMTDGYGGYYWGNASGGNEYPKIDIVNNYLAKVYRFALPFTDGSGITMSAVNVNPKSISVTFTKSAGSQAVYAMLHLKGVFWNVTAVTSNNQDVNVHLLGIDYLEISCHFGESVETVTATITFTTEAPSVSVDINYRYDIVFANAINGVPDPSIATAGQALIADGHGGTYWGTPS